MKVTDCSPAVVEASGRREFSWLMQQLKRLPLSTRNQVARIRRTKYGSEIVLRPLIGDAAVLVLPRGCERIALIKGTLCFRYHQFRIGVPKKAGQSFLYKFKGAIQPQKGRVPCS